MYNRTSNSIKNNPLYFKINHISGQMYLIPNFIFNLLKKENMFNKKFKSDENSADDVMIYRFVLNHGLNLFNSSSSYIQHIGINSLLNKGKYLRYSKNFLKPYAWNINFDA